MTSYFDEKQEQAGRLLEFAKKIDESLLPESMKWHDEFKALEEQVVFDCTVCVEFPGCPEEDPRGRGEVHLPACRLLPAR